MLSPSLSLKVLERQNAEQKLITISEWIFSKFPTNTPVLFIWEFLPQYFAIYRNQCHIAAIFSIFPATSLSAIPVEQSRSSSFRKIMLRSRRSRRFTTCWVFFLSQLGVFNWAQNLVDYYYPKRLPQISKNSRVLLNPRL